jgi:hypothetical protein
MTSNDTVELDYRARLDRPSSSITLTVLHLSHTESAIAPHNLLGPIGHHSWTSLISLEPGLGTLAKDSDLDQQQQ